MRISDWSSDVCSADLAGDHSDWRPDRGDDPDPPRFAGDRKGGARCNRRQAPQARRTSRAERTRAGVKEKIMTEAIKLLRIYRSEEHTSELQSLMRISYAVFCLKKKTTTHNMTLTYMQRYH